MAALCVVMSLGFAAGTARGDSHGIAMYGEPALPADFDHLPYAEPDAPKGGRVATGEVGSFDSINPFILKGTVPWQLRSLAAESLLGRSYDEPFSLYGLLAESVQTAPDRSWVEFTLRPEARFSDGSPVTVEDVIWSYETIGTQGHPRYRSFWDKVASIEPVGERGVRIEFAVQDPELALLAGLRPILKKAQWEGVDFAQSGLDVVPISSAPYVIDEVVPGRYVSLRRDPDYWGADVPFMRGQANFDEIRLEFYGDAAAMFEAFKAGELSIMRETNAAKWATQYDFPAVRDGRVVLEEVPHSRPSGILGLVMNTRRAPFDDIRVRDALIHAFNFEFINEALNDEAVPRIASYFSNSPLGMGDGPAEGRVRALLEPFAETLPEGALEGYALPVSDGTQRNRANVAAASEMLAEAGWTIQDGALRNAAGEPFAFEILIQQGATEVQQIVDIYAQALGRLGIEPKVTTVDSAQYADRMQDYDFDMAWQQVGLSLSPGNEQYLYWGAAGVTEPGSRNLAGISDPAAEAMIGAILSSKGEEEFVAATQALDRVLTAGRYVIPVWQSNVSRIAYDARHKHAERIPIYGDFAGWHPDVWWSEPAE